MPVRALLVLAGASLVLLTAPDARPADGTLGTFRDWIAQSFVKDERRTCMLWSQPQKSEGKYTKRGDVYLFVTHRPAESTFDAVSIETGYTYRESSRVEVTIDGKSRFDLDSAGTVAWSLDVGQNRKLVRAMRAGREMVVEGVSSRGTRTTDTYSLLGFTKAHNAIDKACERP